MAPAKCVIFLFSQASSPKRFNYRQTLTYLITCVSQEREEDVLRSIEFRWVPVFRWNQSFFTGKVVKRTRRRNGRGDNKAEPFGKIGPFSRLKRCFYELKRPIIKTVRREKQIKLPPAFSIRKVPPGVKKKIFLVVESRHGKKIPREGAFASLSLSHWKISVTP